MLAQAYERGLHVSFEFAPIVNLSGVKVADVGGRLFHQLVNVPKHERQIQQEHNPMASDQKENAG